MLTRIFHPTDFSPASDVAFAHALRLALAQRGALTILHFARKADAHDDIHEFPQVRATLERWGLLPANSSRTAVAATLGVHVRKVEVGGDDPTEAILQYIHGHPTDLMVAGTHQRSGAARWLYREVASPVARRSSLPTLFVPPDTTGFVAAATGHVRLQRILVPIDRHPHPHAVIEMLPTLIGALHAGRVHVELVHVGASDTLPHIQIPEIPGWTWTTQTIEGDIVPGILDAAEAQSSDMLVLATQGRRGFPDTLIGSTTERVVRHARCPVLAVPSS